MDQMQQQHTSPLPGQVSNDPEKNQERSEGNESVQDEKALLKWNASPRTICKSLATFYSMLLLGLNDAVYGVRCRPPRASRTPL